MEPGSILLGLGAGLAIAALSHWLRDREVRKLDAHMAKLRKK